MVRNSLSVAEPTIILQLFCAPRVSSFFPRPGDQNIRVLSTGRYLAIGTGLGLAIVKRINERHGGEM